MKTEPLRGAQFGAGAINVLVGIWLIVAPFVIGFADIEAAKWNDIVVGALVVVVAAVRSFGGAVREGWNILNVVLGAWLLLAPWTLGYSDNLTPLGHDSIMGLTVLLLTWLATLEVKGS